MVSAYQDYSQTMDILLTKEQELYMEWDPQYTFVKKDDGTYLYQSWQSVSRKEQKARLSSMFQPRINVPPIPKTLKFVIHMRVQYNNMQETEALFHQLKAIFMTMKDDGDEINVEAPEPYKYKYRMGRKPEFEKELALIDKQNEERNQRAEELIDELRKLGCGDTGDLDEIGSPTTLYGPDEYYEWVDKLANIPPISVQCHEGTRFYQFLKTNGLIERFFPDWYMQMWKKQVPAPKAKKAVG